MLNITPTGREGGIWLSDTGPAVDGDGNVYVPTGNGTFDAGSGGQNYGDTVLKLALDGSSLAIRDYFTPHDQERISQADADVGSSGPLLLPDQAGSHRHLLLQPTKDSTIYMIDRDRMGRFRQDHDAVVQRFRVAGGGYGAMAYWNGHIFFAASDDYPHNYSVKNNLLTVNATSSTKFRNPGATPSVPAHGGEDGIVWAIANKTWDGADNKPAVLYAFDAVRIGSPIFASEQNSKRDRAGLATRFAIPIVMNGHVYFGARGEVEVYGLLK